MNILKIRLVYPLERIGKISRRGLGGEASQISFPKLVLPDWGSSLGNLFK